MFKHPAKKKKNPQLCGAVHKPLYLHGNFYPNSYFDPAKKGLHLLLR